MFILTLSVLALWSPGSEPGTVASVAVGSHYRIECHFEHGASADQALAVAEAVWPIAAGLYPDETGIGPSAAAQSPLVVHLYRNARDYNEAENQLTGGLYRRNQAFAHRMSRTAHVAIQPALGDRALDQLGLPEQTLRLIAHEAAHLARFARMPNNGLHPAWFVDGNAGFVDQEVMEAIGCSPGLESDPYTSQEILSLQSLLAEGRLPSVRKVFRNTLQSISFYERYALRHLFFRYLWEGGFRDELEHIRDRFGHLVRGPDTPIELARSIHAILAPRGGMDSLDEPFQQYIRGFDPLWEEAHRSLTLRDGDWLQVGFPDDDATAWSTRRPATDTYSLHGALELVGGINPQLNLHFARAAGDFLTITFVAGHAPALYRYADADHSWHSLATGGPIVPIGRPQEFELAVEPGQVRLLIDGQLALHERCDFDPRGAWGLAAHSASAGRWSDLRIRPTAGKAPAGR